MKILFILSSLILSAHLSIALAQTPEDIQIKALQELIYDTKEVKVECSGWVDKLNCISYLKRVQKELTFKAAPYNLTKIVIDELENSAIHMNKVVRLSVFQDFNLQLRKLIPTIHKVDELKVLSRSYSKGYSFRIFCGSTLTPRQCELGLFNFLKSRPEKTYKGKIKKVIITQEDQKLSDKGSLYLAHNNHHPVKYINFQLEQRAPAQIKK